jgi:hypothetical protein
MRIAIGVFLGSTATGGASSPYAAYALAEVFTLPQYWVAGTQYTPITALPGYTFTRSGIQGAVDASGQFFAANVPAINSAGFHVYGALTNTLPQSQAFDNASWTKNLASVTANTDVGPDGTTTADSFITSGAAGSQYIFQGTADTGVVTVAVVAKAGTNAQFFQIYHGSNATFYANFDLVGGTVGTVGAGAAGYIRALANGYYLCVAVMTIATAQSFILTQIPASNSGPVTAFGATVATIFLWQAQVIAGNFPNGGPIIATTTAAVGIGAYSLTNTVANGSYTATYTFDDNSTQTIATTIAAGVFTFPTTLNRNVVKQVLMS